MPKTKIYDKRHQHHAKKLHIYARTEPTKTNRQARGLAKLDGRTKPGRLAAAFRRDLIEFCGGNDNLNIIQREIIERCVYMQVKLALLDKKICEGQDSAYDNKTYLSWAANIQRALHRLGYTDELAAAKNRAEAALVNAYARRR